MLGYDVDFGHREMIELVGSQTFAEKLVGYMATSVMVRSTDAEITLLVHAIKNDLANTQDTIQCLALCAIANLGGKELCEAVVNDVQLLLMSRAIFPVVRKKAALCLLRLSRISKDVLNPEEWSQKIYSLLGDKNLGVNLSLTGLLNGLIERDGAAWSDCIPHVLSLLGKLAMHQIHSEDHLYHTVLCPWLQVKALRIVKQLPYPTQQSVSSKLIEILTHILANTEVTKSVNRNNAEHCVLFEAINVIIIHNDYLPVELRERAIVHLSKFINIREPNIRYLGLETMTRLSDIEETRPALRKHLNSIMFSLKDADISIRRRALDLLFAICNEEIAINLVDSLITVLVTTDTAFRDEMVLKIAILSERYATDMNWYIDVVIQLLNIAGDHVTDDIWHRVVQIVTNREEVQAYAVSKLYHALEPQNVHENAVKLGGYILGEFGYMLNEGDVTTGQPISGAQQFAVLHQHFPKCSASTRALLLSSYAKMANLYTELTSTLEPIFRAHTTVMDMELQQRAVEYLHFPSLSPDLLATVLDAMPPFANRMSALELKIQKAKEVAKDKDLWGKEEKLDAEPEEEEEEEQENVTSVTVVQPVAAELDLLGLGSLEPNPAAAPVVDAASIPVTNRIGINTVDAAQITNWHQALLTKPGGIVFEDASIQIGAKSSWEGANGVVTLYFGNKTNVPLVQFRVRVKEHPGVQCIVGDAPGTLSPSSQVPVTVQVKAMAPFAEPPQLQISFISQPGTGHAYPLPFPVAVPNFCDPISMGAEDFKGRWAGLAGSPRECTAIITPTSGAGVVTVENATKAIQAAKFAPCASGAPGATGASSFRTNAMSANNTPISVGCLAMIIPDANSGVFKTAVRTQHPEVSKAIMKVLHHYLSRL